MLLLVALVTGIVVLTPVADRIRVPQPILLLIYGLLLALVPWIPEPAVHADLVLPVVLPPLLFAATQRTTIGQFRDAARPILLLAVGLTVATAAAVAVVAHLMGLPWPAAAVLGAIVSPPDPVAATAVARRLRLPERMVTVLEGEGMFNDATALVLYKVAVAAAVTGQFHARDAALELLLSIAVGTGTGIALGWLTTRALAALHDAAPETTVTIAAPFLAYLGAEHLRGSGVLAVLALGLYLRSHAHPALTARGWLLGRAVWDYADFVITGLVFTMVGFELTTVIEHASTDLTTLWLACAVIAAVVTLRPLWLFPAVALAATRARRTQATLPYGWRETALVSWAGMRGVVTVATALALPLTADDGTRLDWREPVVLVGLGCVLVTLLAQGLTLTPLVRRLGVGTDADEAQEIRDLQLHAMRAAVQALRCDPRATTDPAWQAAITRYEGRLNAHELIRQTLATSPEQDGTDLQQRLEQAWQHGNDVEREITLHARARGTVTPAAADHVLHDIEVRAARTGP